ncbi:hypothetical protein COLO4_17385 [Corchorus olitorius]|uniref:TIR domain-containing protein n=1 Tax=Corchorus olitorius TaxID=93759 RepID=A0A1R3JCY8_9ROSI|nr:hypothetical protein COLO4_17385 [Corchorus olitorius]
MLSIQSSSSCSYVSRKKYDVFLSFRGEDTRNNFTDHLYAALVRRGIVTFRDNERLEAGESIAPELFKAIQESWGSVIVFSETYAFSGIGIDALIKKSLIKVYGDKDKYLWMHDLLQEMGRKIVKQKSLEEPGKRCRLWEGRDVYDVLTKNTASANSRQLNIVLPGSEIPEWFSNQRDGCSIKIPLPYQILNDSQCIGVAFCCVFVNAIEMRRKAFIHGRKSQNVDNHVLCITNGCSSVTKDHLLLGYWSRDYFYSIYSLEEKCGETEQLSSLESDELEVVVEVDEDEMLSSKPTIKKCGIHIVYKKDVEEMEQIKEHHILQIGNTTIEDIPQPQNGDESEIGKGALVKRKRNFYEKSESDKIEERPQPKRLQQFLKCIMRKEL